MGSRYVVLALILLLAGCRQSDAPMPMPDEEVREELGDVQQDLQNIASGRGEAAPEELAEDLRKYVVRPSAVGPVDELARRTAAALPGRTLTEQAAERLAYTLWVAVTARDLSERQIEALQDDIAAQLTDVGVSGDAARLVAAQVAEVQGAVTDRQRRWYEMF